ncbi:alpha/beta-hydrolase [Panus rudis PR-1116 ss-1]|nr:alpha/beta-hydrolase [Panus rudis PR-1116 ss-1]
MQNIWFPIPVAVLFRRLVNVVSTLSISHHYLAQRRAELHPPDNSQCPVQTWRALKTLDWLSSLLGKHQGHAGFSLALDGNTFGHDQEPANRPPEGRRRNRDHETQSQPSPEDTLHRLMNNPVLFEPVRVPRYPIVLCHGLYGFDVRGPSAIPFLQQHYWENVLRVLRGSIGAEVVVTGVPGTGSIASRAESLDRILQNRVAGRAVNLFAHSMGGLDCRHLISHIQPTDYAPVSLTTIGTPHRGSPFMDWCMENIGLGKLKHPHEASQDDPQVEQQRTARSSFTLSLASLPSSFTTLLLSLLDSPAYANLTSTYLNTIFNPNTPNSPNVKYFSVAGRIRSLSVWHPLWLPKMVLDGFEEKEREKGRLIDPSLPEHERWGNDGLVTVQSARWGEYLGTLEECDHWALRGAKGLDMSVELLSASKKAVDKEESDWKLGDWTKFVTAWRREEKKARGAGASVSESHDRRDEQSTREEAERMQKKGESAPVKDFADDVVKASTEKLSVVFDWIVEQVPSRGSGSAQKSEGSSQPPPKPQKPLQSERKSDLRTKADLERFYVALCKKLYDEGL